MKLELFERETCPYCQKVLRYLQVAKRDDVELHDITADEAARARLVEVGGMQQVPCLFIDGRPLYESDDIISWLREHPQA